MAFSEINDPKGLCKDVSDVGRWGNGDVEVNLSTLDQLPYVMSLVRQSFEKQMGSLSEV
jgi:predicted transport protein